MVSVGILLSLSSFVLSLTITHTYYYAGIYIDRFVGDGQVEFGVHNSEIRQGEIHEGERFDITLQLQLDPNEGIGSTGIPLNVCTWKSSRGATDSEGVPHDTLGIFLPCEHVSADPILEDTAFAPRLDRSGSSIILHIRGT